MANSVVNLAAKFVIPMVLMYLLVGAPYAEGAVSCSSVTTKIAPCLNYLTKGVPLQPTCCDGVKALYAAAPTTPDRQATCGCLKTLAAGVPGLNLARISTLPANCGVPLPFKISPAINNVWLSSVVVHPG